MDSWNDKEMIAIVGNGPIADGLGSDIDDHKIVVRFNSFVTDGYESRVGSKTTHHSISHSLLVRNCEIHGKLLVPTPLSNVSDPLVKYVKDIVKDNNGLHIDRQYSEMGSLMAGLIGHFPTSGLMTISYFLLSRIGKISLYGFACGSGHYWSPDDTPTGSHNFLAEIAFYRKLDKLGIVDLIE